MSILATVPLYGSIGLSFTIMVMIMCMIMTFSCITIAKSQQMPFSIRKIGGSVCDVLEFL